MEIEIFGRKFCLLVNEMQYAKLRYMLFLYFNKPTIILVLICVVSSIIWVLRARKAEENCKIYKRKALISYVVLILALTVLNRESGSCRELRLIYDPWFFGEGLYHESTIIITIFDCILFVPFGMLYRWLAGRTSRYISFVTVIVLAGFMVEFFQYILARGVSSIEDFTAFIVGGGIGFVLIDLLERFQKT